MPLFRNIVLAAVIAGLLSGLMLTVMQSFATVPLIVQAETFEDAGAEAGHSHDQAHSHDAAAPTDHQHDAEAWMPADGAERFLYTAAANMLAGIGFALLLVTAAEALGGLKDWRGGLMFGLAGFLAFSLAPGLGLPPELPGMPAAELGARQLWWVATAGCTAVGLGFLAYTRTPVLAIVAVVLLVLPHILGAPHPVSHETAVPAELHARFVAAVLATSLVFWALLGAVSGLVRTRLRGGEEVYSAGTAEPVR
jgi:cobalt transporter subunit CbtA